MKQIIEIQSRIDRFDVLINIPENWKKDKLIIGCHGFDSSKDSDAMVLFGEYLEKVDIAYALFCFPYHAERRIDENDLTIDNCISDLMAVEEKIVGLFPNVKLGVIANSFGAYILLNRIKKYKHNYFAIILKSPAIKMDEILKNCLIEDSFEIFSKNGYTVRHRKSPMKVKFEFYEAIKENTIEKLGEFNEKILVYHGNIDDTAPFEDIKEFCDRNKNTSLIEIENESHKLSMNNLKKIYREAANYFCNN